MKKLLSIFICFTMLISTFVFTQTMVNAADKDRFTDGDYQYEILDDGNVLIYRYNGDDAIIEIPSTLGGKNVVEIGISAFGSKSATKIIIPYGVKTISESAFQYCSKLESIEIPNSVTFMDESTFYWCEKLKSVVIPDSVTSIGKNLFYHCYDLESVKFSDSMTEIPKGTFYYCKKLTNVVLPKNLQTIGDDAFYASAVLSTITFPASLKTIGERAFYWCNEIKDVYYCGTETDKEKISIANQNSNHFLVNATWHCNADWPTYPPENPTNAPVDFDYKTLDDGTAEITGYTGSETELVIPSEIDGKAVTSIGDYAFEDCTTLTSVTIENGITNIGERAFEDCTSLESIEIPNSVTSIGWYAFWGCTSLTSITIPDSVTSIGWWAFCNCSSMTNITIGNGITSIGSYAFSNTAYYNNQSNWDDNVLYIGNYLIDANDTISGAYSIIENTKVIADYAFDDCTSLTSITIPNSVTSISGCAFDDCTSLASITIPDSVTSIGSSAFNGCSSLTSITIPDSVTSIVSRAFNGCDSLSSIIVDSNNKVYDSRDNCNAIINTETNELIAGCKDTIIPNTVTSIGWYAFWGCTSLTSITIPESVTSIGWSAFEYCESLTSITIGNGVTSIGNEAFYDTAYYNNQSNWENNVLYIGNYLISGKYQIYNEDTWEYETVFEATGTYSIKEGTKAIADYAFNGCKSITSITIPDSVTSIGNCAFEDCTSLTSITIPDSVTSIGYKALGYCYDYDNYEYVKVQGFTITGYTGSEAESYANDNGFEFIDIENQTTPTNPEQPTTQPSTNPEQSTQPSTQPTTAPNTPSAQSTQPSTKPTTPTVNNNVSTKDAPISPAPIIIAKQTLKTPKVKYTSGKKQIKIKYTKVKNAVGFQVRYRIKGKWKYKNFTTKKSVTKTLKKLKKGKYKIQIRSFAKGKKYYSNWTKVKTVKVK